MDPERTKLDKLEQISRIISMLAIPVVLAVIGWFVQVSLAKSSVNQEWQNLGSGLDF